MVLVGHCVNSQLPMHNGQTQADVGRRVRVRRSVCTTHRCASEPITEGNHDQTHTQNRDTLLRAQAPTQEQVGPQGEDKGARTSACASVRMCLENGSHGGRKAAPRATPWPN